MCRNCKTSTWSCEPRLRDFGTFELPGHGPRNGLQRNQQGGFSKWREGFSIVFITCPIIGEQLK